MNFVGINEVHKSYGSRKVLRNINLEVKRNEILGIIGPNGAGKSTLLRLVNLIEKPDSGKIIFEGVDTGGLEGEPLLKIRGRVGAVLQSPVLFRGSVKYNVSYGLGLRGIEDERAVSNALRRMGLSGFEERKVHELSGGEAQRVALARAIVFEPDLLLLDEPAADVDNENARLIERAIVGMGRKTAVVLSTHDLFQAKRIADRTAFMDRGRILECANTRRLLKNPANKRTRRFVSGEAVF